jgi:hypothetical protein
MFITHSIRINETIDWKRDMRPCIIILLLIDAERVTSHIEVGKLLLRVFLSPSFSSFDVHRCERSIRCERLSMQAFSFRQLFLKTINTQLAR